MRTYHLIIFIILIIIKLYLCLPLLEKKPNKCIKNSTDSIHYPPYFKHEKICKYQFNYTLVPFGDKFSFNCKYDSNPPSRVAWSRYNNTKNDVDIIQISNSTSRFTINSVTLNDDGFYACTVFNSLGSVTHSFYLHVNDRPLVHPIFIHKNENFESKINGEATLDCSFQSDESSDLNFYKANKLNNFTYDQLVKLNSDGQHAEYIIYQIEMSKTFDLLPENLISNETSESITLNNLTEDDFGIYLCVADNRYGKQLKFINLKKIENENDNLPLIVIIILAIFVILIILFVILIYRAKKSEKELELSKKNPRCVCTKKRYIIKYDPNAKLNYNELKLNNDDPNNKIPTIEVEQIQKEIRNESDLQDEFSIEIDEDWEIDRDRLEFNGDVIGTGNFGVVERAILHDKPLNKKNDYVNDTVLNENSDDNQSKNSESTTKELNFLNIMEHYNNKTTIMTAYNNNYYGINYINSINSDDQQSNQFIGGNYGKIKFPNLDYSINDETNLNRIEKIKIVAVKKLKKDYCESDILSFIVEMDTMKRFANHKNLINLIGCSTQAGPLYLIMEFAELGNLKDFLKNYRKNKCCLPDQVLRSTTNDNQNQARRLTTNDLINFALQIANGMEHLSSHYFIHRDLAARNILVTSDLTMKISDFGLSKSIGDSEYYRKKSNGVVPIKWLAPECFEKNIYTRESDVWSYGVTLWELTSLGCTPYKDVPVSQMFIYLRSERRMSKPKWCTDKLYKLMLECWQYIATDRPKFEKITSDLRNIYQKSLDPLVIDEAENDEIQTPDTTLSTTFYKNDDGYVDFK